MDNAGQVNQETRQPAPRSVGALQARVSRKSVLQRVGIAIGLACAFGSVLFTSARADAQEWLRDRMYQEGAGIRTGDLEWHPGIAAEGGYDSNYFLRTDTVGGACRTGCINGSPIAPVQGTPVMRITPSLSLATLGPQRREGSNSSDLPVVNFRLNASGTYREFFGQLTPEQRNFSADVNSRLDILPERPLGGAIFASYDRTIQPNSVNGDPDLSFNRDTIGVGAEIVTQPGGGTLDWHFGYQFMDTLFETSAGQPYANFTNQAYMRGHWKFRPRTALIYDGSIGFFHYDNTTAVALGGAASAEAAGEISPLLNSTPVRSRIGINGLVTPRLSFLGLVGYGGSFYSPATATDNVQQYDSVIGQAELKYYLTAQPGDGPAISLTLSSIALGYTRDFVNSYLADYYGSDRGYVKFSYFFAGRALVSLEGGLGAIEYPTVTFIEPGTPAHAAFTDARVDATLYGEYRFTNFFGLNLTARYTNNISNTVLDIGAAPGGGMAQLLAMQWQRFEVYAGVRLFL
jgi:hypothetical protein